MIKNWKLGMKSLKYAYGIKMNVLVGIAFLALAGVMYITKGQMMSGLGGDYMLMCAALLPTQMIYSLSASNMVQASTVRKKMQTSVPAMVTYGNMVLVYLVMILIRLVTVFGHPERTDRIGGDLVVMAGMMLLFMVYTGAAYKYFMLSVAMVIVTVLIISPYNNIVENDLFSWVFFSRGWRGIVLSAALGLLLLTAGGLLQYLVSLLVYKKPMSKMAQAAPLRKEL